MANTVIVLNWDGILMGGNVLSLAFKGNGNYETIELGSCCWVL